MSISSGSPEATRKEFMKAGPAILLYRGRSFVSRAIMWRTWGTYSHAALLTSRGTIIEAWHFGGVREIPYEHTPNVDLFIVRGMDSKRWTSVEERMRSQLGKPYDYIGILRFLLRRNAHNEAWFCSELLAWAFAEEGVPLLRRPPHQISPHCIFTSPLVLPNYV